jgi:hypothetical protein
MCAVLMAVSDLWHAAVVAPGLGCRPQAGEAGRRADGANVSRAAYQGGERERQEWVGRPDLTRPCGSCMGGLPPLPTCAIPATGSLVADLYGQMRYGAPRGRPAADIRRPTYTSGTTSRGAPVLSTQAEWAWAGAPDKWFGISVSPLLKTIQREP